MKAIGIVSLCIALVVSLSGCFGSGFSEGAKPLSARYGSLDFMSGRYLNGRDFVPMPKQDHEKSHSAPAR